VAKEFSPEEKLLNLIRRKNKDQSAPAQEPLKPSPATPGKKPPLKQERESKPPQVILSLNNIVKLEHIKVLNTVLFSMLVIIILYFLIDIFLIPPKEIAILEAGEGRQARAVEEIELKPYTHYSQGLGSKKVFKSIAREETVTRAQPEVPAEEIIGNLALLGIVTGEIPQAIIEDKKLKKRFFLKEGQSSSGVLLKEIDDGMVTVVYKGEEFNLSL
jgi:hypothetical protein